MQQKRTKSVLMMYTSVITPICASTEHWRRVKYIWHVNY